MTTVDNHPMGEQPLEQPASDGPEVGSHGERLFEQTFFEGRLLMEKIERSVTTYELEIGSQGEAFNALLEKTRVLDSKIENLAVKISEAKRAWARASVKAIEADLQQVAEVVRRVQAAGSAGIGQVQEDVAVLTENREIAAEERERLLALGVPTGEIDRRIEVFDRALQQLQQVMRRLESGEAAPAPSRVDPQKWRAELMEVTREAMQLAREVLSEDAELVELEGKIGRLQDRFLAVPEMPDHQDWQTTEQTVRQLGRVLGQRHALQLEAFLNDQLTQIHAQIEGAMGTDDPEDIPVLKENWEAFEENVMLAGGKLAEIPEAARKGVTAHFEMVVAEWRRLEMVIGEAEQRLRLLQP